MWVDSTPLVEQVKLEAKFWSDDSIVKIKKSEVPYDDEFVLDVSQSFNEFFTRHGIVIHDKKPYFGRKGCFLEIYGTTYGKRSWDHKKIGQYIGCLFDCIKCPSIYRAKEFFSALLLTMPEELYDYASLALSQIVSYWGYEFSPKELLVPFECGGWSFIVEDGYNMLLQRVQDFQETKELNALVRLMNFKVRRKRTLPLHREHKAYINSIKDLGSSLDTSPYSWSMMAISTLSLDYKGRRDLIRIEEGILQSRQKQWRACMRSQLPIIAEVFDFWDAHKGESWYVPPMKYLTPQRNGSVALKIKFKEKFHPCPSLDKSRAWHRILSQLGYENLAVSDPNYTYSSNFNTICDLMSLYVRDGQEYSYVKTCFTYGYDPESLQEKIEATYGPGYQFKDRDLPFGLFDKVCKELLGDIKQYMYVVPNSTVTYFSNIHRYDSIVTSFKSSGKEALIPWVYSRLEGTGYEDDWYLVTELAEEIQEDLTLLKPAKQQRIDLPEESDSPSIETGEAGVQQLEYLRAMVMEAASLAGAMFSDDPNRAVTTLDPSAYVSAFDDDEEGRVGIFDQSDY